jgi:hypothetical protein
MDPDPDPGGPTPRGSGSATPVLCCRSAGGGAAGDGQPQQEPRAGEAEGGEPRAKGQGNAPPESEFPEFRT